MTFYFTHTENNDTDRIYQSLDELRIARITAPSSDYDGVLICQIDECFRLDEDDDMLGYFDWITGVDSGLFERIQDICNMETHTVTFQELEQHIPEYGLSYQTGKKVIEDFLIEHYS